MFDSIETYVDRNRSHSTKDIVQMHVDKLQYPLEFMNWIIEARKEVQQIIDEERFEELAYPRLIDCLKKWLGDINE